MFRPEQVVTGASSGSCLAAGRAYALGLASGCSGIESAQLDSASKKPIE